MFVAIMFLVVLVFAGLPGHGPVQANYNNAAVGASAIFVILVMVTTLDLLYYIATHAIGKPEGRQ